MILTTVGVLVVPLVVTILANSKGRRLIVDTIETILATVLVILLLTIVLGLPIGIPNVSPSVWFLQASRTLP